MISPKKNILNVILEKDIMSYFIDVVTLWKKNSWTRVQSYYLVLFFIYFSLAINMNNARIQFWTCNNIKTSMENLSLV